MRQFSPFQHMIGLAVDDFFFLDGLRSKNNFKMPADRQEINYFDIKD